MDFDQFMKPSSEVEGRSSYLVYATQDGQALNQENLLEEKQIDLKQNSKGYYITGKGMERYLVVYEQLPYGDLLQYYISPYGSFWSYMGALQWFLLFAALFYSADPDLVFLYVPFLRSTLRGLKATMEEIAEGDLNAHAEENSDVEEFRLMATTFNHMMDQIQKLKIDAYEQERRIQNATIQYLQIQIRPHFF